MNRDATLRAAIVLRQRTEDALALHTDLAAFPTTVLQEIL
jgi:hypothetical protein